MTAQAFPTDVGAAKLALAASGDTYVPITHFSVGSGSVAHTPASTALTTEEYSASVSSKTVDPTDPSTAVIEIVIPAEENGFFIRELALFDADGDLIVIANTPVFDKTSSEAPLTVTLNPHLKFSNADRITVAVNPGAFASVAYVNSEIGKLPNLDILWICR